MRPVDAQRFKEIVRGKLIVSCQARPGTPLDHPLILAAMAQAVEQGGAAALRAAGAANIAAMRRVVKLPIIGLHKRANREETYITPLFEQARELAEAGADLIAVQATSPRLGSCTPLPELISRIQRELGLAVIADISTLREAEAAAAAGADLVATTLSGYTPHSPQQEGPDLELVAAIARRGIPVLAEGRYHRPQQAVEALRRGALAVVVGTAITMPDYLTRHFVQHLEQAEEHS